MLAGQKRNASQWGTFSWIQKSHLTCSWHVFTNSKSTNFFLYHFKTRKKYSIEIKKFIYSYLFSQKKTHFGAPLKENNKFFEKKIRGLGIRENMSRTDWAANNSCRRLKTRETGGQVFACGLGGGLNGGVPLSWKINRYLEN